MKNISEKLKLRICFQCLVIIMFLAGINYSYSQVARNSIDCNKTESLIKNLQQNHISPPQINDEFAAKVYRKFLYTLDPYCIYFTEEDLSSLPSLKLTNESSCEFFNKVSEIFRKRLLYEDSLIKILENTPFNFAGKENISIYPEDSVKYCSNDDALKKRLIAYFKLEILNNLYLMSNEADSSKKNVSSKNVLLKEPESRAGVFKKIKCETKELLDDSLIYEKCIQIIFLNSICQNFDTHTEFFTLSAKKEFESSLSKEILSFGLEFKESENDDITINRIVPGSSAWKSNQIHKGDKLTKITWDDGKSNDLACVDIEDVENMLNTGKNKVELTIETPDKEIRKVTIVKEKLANEDNFINGFILQGSHNYGYISLPSFYGDFKDIRSPGCANDVAKEILKLQKEKINGLILDLRYNGGGSMKEALDLAGIFIEEGPLAIFRDKISKPYIIKDLNRGSIYNGPLIILVNGFSASASEFFASIIKDYNIGVIVGEKTFGKAVGQVVVPLDSNMLNNYSNDFVKVTNHRFYNLKGKSYQREGVVPHIILPSNLGYYKVNESFYSTSLYSDSVTKKATYTPSNNIPYARLDSLNKARLKNDTNFNKIELIQASIANYYKKTRIHPLDKDSYFKKKDALNETIKTMKNLSARPAKEYTVRANRTNNLLLSLDEVQEEITKEICKNINEDIYIEEAYKLLEDLFIYNSSKEK
ncbi:MAG: carboxy terminal-processing peptidase [Bacteroidales bacterium]|nr:carboxy terminal-processing peptidase [Bacteroidales bacterium]